MGVFDSKERVVLKIEEMFRSIGIREKGIAKLYEYLLSEGIVADLNAVASLLNLSPKRVYKVTSVMKELGLVTTFDRPMKITIQEPIKAWETIISRKIEETRERANAQMQALESSLESFRATLKKEFDLVPVAKAPVEFIKYDSLEFVLYPLFASESILIARGNYYAKPDLTRFLSNVKKSEKAREELQEFARRMRGLDVKLLLSEDIIPRIEETISEARREFPFLNAKELGKYKFKSLETRVTSSPFANFTIMDNSTLVQPSFDPAMAETGAFLSEQAETIAIFREKFEVLFSEATSLEQYLKENDLSIDEGDRLLLLII
ncbi:MAG: hypothetical protein ACTSU5_20635 [Promethearchaeota archaeon]